MQYYQLARGLHPPCRRRSSGMPPRQQNPWKSDVNPWVVAFGPHLAPDMHTLVPKVLKWMANGDKRMLQDPPDLTHWVDLGQMLAYRFYSLFTTLQPHWLCQELSFSNPFGTEFPSCANMFLKLHLGPFTDQLFQDLGAFIPSIWAPMGALGLQNVFKNRFQN